ncbi:FliM/FliN family flagellar motor C-terminal domain-containing protein [Sphingomonas hankookensis]|uniref:FliM/FliN family flagellar motor switch protein n=1 Tax=Sphingomonas hankookensis TaxID=563996 RepID=UPI001F569619|nr:FliM/FliN family flagellar motor C-terminal domain-containing protein [Sphingomonas hankookensis]
MVCRWLPPGTVSPALDCDVAQVLADWAQAWFGFAVEPRAGDDAGGLYALGEDVAIGLGGEALGGVALGLRSGVARTDADQRLLDRVGNAVRDDLHRRVGAALALSGAFAAVDRLSWQPAYRQRFADIAGRLSVTMVLGERCFVAASLARLPAPPAGTPLTRLGQAVAARPVRVSVRLGRCTLQLAEMRGMEVGNVLLFDAAIDAALPVVIDDAATGIAAARVVREPERWTLQIDTSRLGKAA